MPHSVKVNASHLRLLRTDAAPPRPLVEYRDGERTDTAKRSLDGRPLFNFEAAAEVDGQEIGLVVVTTATPEVVQATPMGAWLKCVSPDGAVLKVSAKDNYSIRVAVIALDLEVVTK